MIISPTPAIALPWTLLLLPARFWVLVDSDLISLHRPTQILFCISSLISNAFYPLDLLDVEHFKIEFLLEGIKQGLFLFIFVVLVVIILTSISLTPKEGHQLVVLLLKSWQLHLSEPELPPFGVLLVVHGLFRIRRAGLRQFEVLDRLLAQNFRLYAKEAHKASTTSGQPTNFDNLTFSTTTF